MRRIEAQKDGVMRNDVKSSDRADARAKRMRKELTPPELWLWLRLRECRRFGLPFRRQHPLGEYIADFYCHAARLVVEVDGPIHATRGIEDARRDQWMTARGLFILRLTSMEVARNPGGAANECLRLARERATLQEQPNSQTAEDPPRPRKASGDPPAGSGRVRVSSKRTG